MRSPAYWGKDATHANAAYGASALQKVFGWAANDAVPASNVRNSE
jgi:hypothetical protein